MEYLRVNFAAPRELAALHANAAYYVANVTRAPHLKHATRNYFGS